MAAQLHTRLADAARATTNAIHASLRRVASEAAAAAALGAVWVVCALYIANAAARCARLAAGAGGSLLQDDRCRVSMEYALFILYASLIGWRILRRLDAREKLDELESRLLMIAVTPLPCSLGLILFGSAIVLAKPPDPAMAEIGSIIASVGWLGISIDLCCLGIPHAMLRLWKPLSVQNGRTVRAVVVSILVQLY
uniref:Uncharacterized protein n=1 Tax=Leersia perrieri TaxID=77586 RepID=A0A0D9X7V3_9ORYZ